MTRVLVCGGRMFGRVAHDCPPGMLAAEKARASAERLFLYGVLSIHKPSVIIHGAGRGADEFADFWALTNSIPRERYEADWRPDGGPLDRSAGPKRNQRMIDEGKPELVIAFPGNRGTADMIRRAKAAGIEVVQPLPRIERA